MQKQLHIYPTLIVLSYLGAGWSIKSQLLNRQQRDFVVRKIQNIFPDNKYIIDLHPQSSWNIKDSQILNIANYLCFKIYNKTTIEVLYHIFNQLIDPSDLNKPKSSNFQELVNFTQSNSKKVNQYFEEDEEEEKEEKKLEKIFNCKKSDPVFRQDKHQKQNLQKGKRDLQEMVNFLFNPEFNKYFKIVETVFANTDLTLDSVFFSRVLNVPKVELYSSNIDCKNLKYKLENIETLNQQENSCLVQHLWGDFYSVKRLILVNNLERNVATKYPNIEYLYINQNKKREDQKLLHLGDRKFNFPNLKKVHFVKTATQTNLYTFLEKIEQFSNVENLYLHFKMCDAPLRKIKSMIEYDDYHYDKFMIGRKNPQFFLIYKRKGELVHVRVKKYY
eukprot:403348458